MKGPITYSAVRCGIQPAKKASGGSDDEHIKFNPDVNIGNNFAVAVDAGGYYETHGVSIHSLMVGPRLKYQTDRMTFFAHTLAGGEVWHAYSTSLGAFALSFGGGVDVKATNRFAIRAFQLDAIQDESHGYWGHNLRGSVGVVWKFGER